MKTSSRGSWFCVALLGQPVALVMALAFSLGGCVKFTGDAGTPPTVTSADQRWTGSGDYSYRLDDAVNGTDVCTTGDHAYTRLADYCLGLEDRDANQACALPRRQEAYAIACGTDFAETDLPAIARFSGYDNNLQRNCTMGSAGVLFFAHQSEDCAYLANESLHHGCGWDARHAEFVSIQCKGTFSPQPTPATDEPTPTPAPMPTATPWPTPTPHPTATPAPVDNRPQVVKDLAAAGISTVVMTSADHANPFWSQLTSVRDLLLARHGMIAQIAVSDFLSYDSRQKILQLGTQFTGDDLRQYISLLDRRVAFESRSGIALSLGVDANQPSADHVLHPINEEIVALEKQQAALTAVPSALREITVGDSWHYRLTDSSLRLTQTQFASDLAASLTPLQQIASFASFAAGQDLMLDDSQTDSSIAPDQLASVLHGLDRDDVKKAIKDLVASLGLRKLAFTHMNMIYLGQDEVDLPAQTAPQVSNADVLREMDSQVTKSAALGIQIVNSTSSYDASYMTAMSKLDARFSVIKGKKTKFDEIELNNEPSSYSDGVLRIGSVGTLADLDQILAKIH